MASWEETPLLSQAEEWERGERREKRAKEEIPDRGRSKERVGFRVYLVCSWVLFLEGMGGLSSLALSYFYKSTLKADPALLSSISSISALPWTCKPIYGFLSDAYPLFGFRRRPYLALGGAAAALSWIYMATSVNDPWTGGVCMTFGSAGMAVANVMAEAILVERSQVTCTALPRQAHAVCDRGRRKSSHRTSRYPLPSASFPLRCWRQSVVWGAASVGSLISSFLGGYAAPSLRSTPDPPAQLPAGNHVRPAGDVIMPEPIDVTTFKRRSSSSPPSSPSLSCHCRCCHPRNG